MVFDKLKKMVNEERLEETVKAVKMMIVGASLSEYGSRLIVGGSEQLLKQKLKRVIDAVRDTEMTMVSHSVITKETRDVFRREFSSGRMVLIAEIVDHLTRLDEDSLEHLLQSISENNQ